MTLKQLLTTLCLVLCIPICGQSLNVHYHLDTSHSFVPGSDVLWLQELPKYFDKSNDPWIRVDVSNTPTDTILLLLYHASGAQVWTQNGSTVKKYSQDETTLFKNNKALRSYLPQHVYGNFKGMPLQLKANQKVRLYLKINKEKLIHYSGDDWRDVSIRNLEDTQKQVLSDALKFIFYLASTLIVILITVLLSMSNKNFNGLPYYVLLCLFNCIFISGKYPVGHLIDGQMTLIPSYYFLPLTNTAFLLFVYHFFHSNNKWVKKLTILYVSISTIFIGLYLITQNKVLCDAILVVINPLMIFCLTSIIWGLVLKLKSKSQWFITIGVSISALGGVITCILHANIISSTFNVFDPLLIGFTLEQFMFLTAIIYSFKKALIDKTILENELRETSISNINLSLKMIQNKNHLQHGVQRIEDQIANDQFNQQELTRFLKSIKINESFMERIEVAIANIHPDFYSIFIKKHPNLSPTDLRVLALYSIQLNNHEIAEILSISIHSLYVLKSRLKKKMNIKGSSIEQYAYAKST